MPKSQKKPNLPAKGPLPEFKRPLGIESIVKCYDKTQRGVNGYDNKLRLLGQYFLSQRLKQYKVWKIEGRFERRITSICWHPKNKSVVAVGSKGGELYLTDVDFEANKLKFVFHHGMGPGGSILSITFDPFSDYEHCYLATLDGTVKKWNYRKNDFTYLLETLSYERWFCSVAASTHVKMIVTGDTDGNLYMFNSDQKMTSKHKIHKSKVNSTDFPLRHGWILATGSLDSTVKIWDLRKFDEKAPLAVLPHKKAINSAVFSLTGTDRLLTTDQYDQVRVYKSPLWTYETEIIHPHRHFQHLTHIKASWHPLSDLIVIGRYPDPAFPGYDPSEPRTVDVFSADTGKLQCQMYTPSPKGIISLNVFNSTGEYLASGMGLNLLFWKWSDRHHHGGKTKKNGDSGVGGSNDSDDDNDDPGHKPPPTTKSREKKPKKEPKGEKPGKKTKRKT